MYTPSQHSSRTFLSQTIKEREESPFPYLEKNLKSGHFLVCEGVGIRGSLCGVSQHYKMIYTSFSRDEKMDTATEPEEDKQDKAEEQNQEDTPAQSVSDQ